MEKTHRYSGMVDISGKEITKRVALASSQITMSPKAIEKLIKGESPKGDVLETAKIAAIMAAKSTSQLIPHCHPLSLACVNIRFELDKRQCSVTSLAEVIAWGPTGVEMEALTAACMASLTIYDMMKWADRAMIISDVMLLKKTGGKSGDYRRNIDAAKHRKA